MGGDPDKLVTLCYISGMVKMERASDYVLRPLAQDTVLSGCGMAQAMERIRKGALYNLGVEKRATMDEAVFDMIGGNCILFFPGEKEVLSFNVGTEEKRSISDPENEPPLKGPRDSFVESVRTNTSLLRRRVRTPDLRIRELLVGRQTVTPVDIVWIEGITNPERVRAVERRVAEIDIDALIATGNLEEYIADDIHTALEQAGYKGKLSVSVDADIALAGSEEKSGIVMSKLTEKFDRVYVKVTADQLESVTEAMKAYDVEFVPIVTEATDSGSYLIEK